MIKWEIDFNKFNSKFITISCSIAASLPYYYSKLEQLGYIAVNAPYYFHNHTHQTFQKK